MPEQPRITINDLEFRSQLRNYSPRPTHYISRNANRPRPRQFSDITAIEQIKSMDRVKPQSAQATGSLFNRLSSPGSHTSRTVLAPPAIPQASPSTASDYQVTAHRLQPPRLGRLHKMRQNKLSILLISLALVVFITGLMVSFNGWRTNHNVQAQVAKAIGTNKKSASTAPSIIKPSAAAIASYSVAPNLPRYLIIPKLGVKARVMSVDVNNQGALGTPNNVFDTAWYNQSSEPGQPGAMLIDGHVSSWTTHGVFYGIKTLKSGDTIQVERGDDTMFTYKVISSQVYSSNNVNMSAALSPIVPGAPGLNLITCTGDIIPGTSLYNKRIIVFAEQV